MKVLHVESGRHLYGGARQVQYITEGLADAGITSVLTCPPGSELAAAIHSNVDLRPLAMGGDADAWLTIRLWRLIRATQPDLVHIHSRRGADLWGGLAARLAGVPCILSRRVDNPEPRWVVASKYRLYDHIITISEGIREVLISEGLAAPRVSCVRSAIDPAPFTQACSREQLWERFGLPPGSLTLGMVAQLIPRKGHRHLFAALPPLLARYPRLHVLIFGRGPLREALAQAIAAEPLHGRVTLAGFHAELPQLLGALDLLAHPADMEGLGISLLQASAAGVPIVATRAGGIPEAVRDNENGLLVAPGDVVALRGALDRLLDDPALRARLGAGGQALVAREFSVAGMVAANLAIYQKVLRG